MSVGNTAQDGMYGFLDTANAVLDSWSDAYVITTSYGQDEHYFSKDVVECASRLFFTLRATVRLLL